MLKKDMVLRNPLRLMGHQTEDILPRGGFGAVLARAGVGKTALMVQIALNALLAEQNVLHVSLNDSVSKVALWYEEVFRNLAADLDTHQTNQVWESILTHRFIMTFQMNTFSAARLQERINELSEQGIFYPQVILLDGLPFDATAGTVVKELKELAQKEELRIWYSVRTHRSQAPDQQGLPVQLSGIADLFDVVIQLQPESQQIRVEALKGLSTDSNRADIVLDPATMLMRAIP